MAVNADKYRPPFTTQRGIDSSLDDCAVVATIHAISDASSGEYTTQASGGEMGRAALHSMARKMRRKIGNDGISIAERQLMCVQAGYPMPKSVDLSFKDLREWLKDRKFSVSVSGNPSKIKGSSPLKRCDCNHEWFIWGECPRHPSNLIYFDGLRPWGKFGPKQRGECRPAKELRQMAFKDKDGELNFVLKYPVGKWTKLALYKANNTNKVSELRETIKGLKESLKNVNPPPQDNTSTGNIVRRALRDERLAIIDSIEQRSPENA